MTGASRECEELVTRFQEISPVHVVVLAAGRGSRLGTLGDETPKWLLRVADRTLADRHVEGIHRAGEAVASAQVVTGHAAEAIVSALATELGGVTPIFNAEWAELNNWWSLLRGLQELPAGAPVAVINADLLVQPEHVAAFLIEAATGAADGLLAVDVEQQVTDESMKVEQGANGTLTRIGKVGLDAPIGEYIGMLMARGPVRDALQETLEGFVGREDCANEWYEGAVGRTAADGQPWHVWPVPSGGWVEIDDDADLDRAQALAGAA
ncbi:MAG: putative sugar nucleotidyltransferase [Solirubrobacterales bacterium]|nr:putative sugar nucleotidyltransferase [Solirubrobacterales bacterium]